PEGIDAFNDIMDALRETDRDLAALQKKRAAVKSKADALDEEIAKLVQGHRRQLIEYGAVGRLAIDKTADILPLDSEKLLADATPVRPDGSMHLDPAKLKARQGAQLKAALKSGAV